MGGGLVAQAVRHSPPTAGIPSLRLDHSMWVSWWTKRGLGMFFTGFLPFSPTTNFMPPFLHTHLIHFVSFHPPLWWCVRRGRPVPFLLKYIGASSHLFPRPVLVLDTSWGYLFIVYGPCIVISKNQNQSLLFLVVPVLYSIFVLPNSRDFALEPLYGGPRPHNSMVGYQSNSKKKNETFTAW